MILSIYVDDQTYCRLRAASRSLGRPVEDLAEAAVSEAARLYSTAEEERAAKGMAEWRRRKAAQQGEG